MSIAVIGLNHTTASVSVRERAYFALDALPLYLQDILQRGVANEAVLLSTCNRSELYCETHRAASVREWFAQQTTLSKIEINAATYLYENEEAVMHMMKVAAGLDSMILGEPQILGQMKQAFAESCTAGAVGTLFHRLFQHIFMVAKKIRTTTAIGACPVSVASAAVHFAKQQVKSLTGLNITLVGAGETAELLLRYLDPYLTYPLVLINRSIENATKLSNDREEKIRIADFDHLPSILTQTDIVFSATGSISPIINKTMISEALLARAGKPILLIDIAVPRDIEAEVALLPHVTLACIDDLKNIIAANLQGREHAANKAREMIQENTAAWMNEMSSLASVAHTIRAYREQIENICRLELDKAKHQLHQGVNPLDVLNAFAYAYTKKLLHVPSAQLRQAGVDGRLDLLHFAKQLFAIPDAEANETFCENEVATPD